MGEAISDAIDVIVVGAGFGGLSTAISLKTADCNVTVYELSKDLSRQGERCIAFKQTFQRLRNGHR